MGNRLIFSIIYNAFIFCIISILASEPSFGLTIINVELTSYKQRIEGFGGSGAFAEGWLYSHPKKQEIYNLIFGGLGTSIYRIRNSYYTGYYPDDMEYQAEAVQAAEMSLGYPVKIMISSWTPPYYLKNPPSEFGGTLARQYYPYGPYKYGEFAQWWADSLTAYKQLGITPTYISIQNEPYLSLEYHSCKFTPSETLDWAGHDRALDAVYQKLSAMINPPLILGPDDVNIYRAGFYIDAISNKTQLYGYAHHLYGTGVGATQEERFDNPDSFIPEMQAFRDKYGYKPILQTEYCRLYNSDGFREAINTAKHIHNSLVEENVAAYLVWGLFWPKDQGEDGLGLVLIDNPSVSDRDYTIQDTYYALMHYSKFIRPGYIRINISDPNVSGLRASAFKSPVGDSIVLVVINPEEESIGFSVSGLNAYVLYKVFQTDSSPNNKCKDITNNWAWNLPGNSITTIIYKNSGGGNFSDLLFTPATPCRAVDTRIASRWGYAPMASDQTRDIRLWGDLSSQGGAAGGCVSSNAKAAVINMVAVPTSGCGGVLTSWAYGQSRPLASTLNYSACINQAARANGVIVPMTPNTADAISVWNNWGTTHIVIDVMGYFAPSP